ncbi:MAG TPA: tetratricopeptide repeat protein, partial [Planctomycetota bacterium]|nr:tetratricopeptide repeat protein [Planctomycetota bacterium]
MTPLLLSALLWVAPLQERTNEHYDRGHELLGKGDLDGAIAAFTKSIELDPKHLASYNERGLARKKKYLLAEAVADFSRAIELDRKSSAAYANRCDAFRRLGRLDEAIKDGEKAVALDPSIPGPSY